MIIGLIGLIRAVECMGSHAHSEGAEVAGVLAALLPAWPQTPGARIEYLPGGYTNRNYKVEIGDDAYALRVVEGRMPDPAERRYLALDIAPEVVAYDTERGHLLTRWIDGEVVANAPLSPDEAGAYLATLHDAVPLGLRRYRFDAEIDAFFGQARQGGLLDGNVAAAFERLDWRPATICGCHNDLNPWNIIRIRRRSRCLRTRSGCAKAPDRLCTLDWESAGDNDPLFDLAGLAIGFGWPLDTARAGLDAYCEHRAVPLAAAQRERRLRDAIRAYQIREYAWAVAQLAAGNVRDEIREQAETMRRTVLERP